MKLICWLDLKTHYLFSVFLVSGRNSQSTQSTIIRNTKIPSLQSTFQKAQKSDDEEPTEPTTQTSNKRKATEDLKSDEDDDDDDGAFQRPSFSNAASTSTTQKPVEKPAAISIQPHQSNKRIPDTGFIIFETIAGPKTDLSLLQTSAAKQGAIVKFETETNKNTPNSP